MHMLFVGQYALPPHEITLNVLLVPQPAGGMSVPPPLLLPLEPVEQLPLAVHPLAIEFMSQHTSVRPFCPGGQHQPAEQ